VNQYYPTGRVSDPQFAQIDRSISLAEYPAAAEAVRRAWLWRIRIPSARLSP